MDRTSFKIFRAPILSFGVSIALLLSGCAGGTDPPPAPNKNEVTTTQDPSANETMLEYDRSNFKGDFETTILGLTDCTFRGTMYYYPMQLATPPVPPGWELKNRTLSPLIDYHFDILSCERFSWGIFDRGPLNLIMEYHGFIEMPEKCTPNGNSLDGYVLLRLWVDDQEIATSLAKHGAPVEFMDLTLSIVGTTTQIVWGPPNHEQSFIIFQETTPLNGELDWLDFYGWMDDQGRANVLEVNLHHGSNGLSSFPMTISMLEPPTFLGSASKVNLFSGQADIRYNDYGTGIWRVYESTKCV